MRITLVGIAAKFVHQSLAPWCLKAGLVQYGVDDPCQVLELNINQPREQTLEMLMETVPQIAAFSCYIWNIKQVEYLVKCLRLLMPDTVIVLGGPEAGYRPESMLRNLPQADYVITGEGEYAFTELCQCLSKGDSPEDIPGLSLRTENGIRTNAPKPLPLPAPSPWTKECLEALNGRIAYLETSRGCPFSCAFCLSGREDSVRFFPLDKAKEELLLVARSGTKTVKLVDRTFNCNPSRAAEIFRFLIEKRRENAFRDVCFHFEVGADLFDEETLQLLQTAPPGLFQIEAGLQSFHEETLEACHRITDLRKLCKNLVSLISGSNIHVHIDLIAGLPFEDFHTFGESFNQAISLSPHMLQLGFLKLLYGSHFQQHAKEYGMLYSPEPPYEVLETNWLSYNDIRRLKRCEEALERLYNSGYFRRTLALVFQQLNLCPFELFCRMGDIAETATGGLSLDQYSQLAFSFFSSLTGIRQEALRDAMALDRLSLDNTGHLPAFLAIPDSRYKTLTAQLRKDAPVGTKIGAYILYDGQERLAYTDYQIRHPVTGEFEISYILL